MGPVQMPHLAASDLGLHCLPYVPQNDIRLVCVKVHISGTLIHFFSSNH